MAVVYITYSTHEFNLADVDFFYHVFSLKGEGRVNDQS